MPPTPFPLLNIVSYLAPNMFWFYERVGRYIGRTFGVETHIVQSPFDPLEDPALLEDRLEIAFICGLPFIQHRRLVPNQLQALAAPVMQASRYGDRPVYFSDIIVNADSDIKTFDHLAGRTFCYNDPGSNSGYNLMRDRLIQGGYPRNFFHTALRSRSHQNSIRLVVERGADCAAIDSTVLEQELRDSPELFYHLRIIESIGPCPMPPVVASQRLGSAFIDSLQSALCNPDAELQAAMERALLRRYVTVDSEDYRAIASMYDAAIEAGYEIIG